MEKRGTKGEPGPARDGQRNGQELAWPHDRRASASQRTAGHSTAHLPQTLGELRTSRESSETRLRTRTVKDEMRENLIRRLQARETIFPGIIGYEDSVVPQIVNAVLSRQNFILLGLRGQAKSRILRALTALLDEHLPTIAGCEIRDNPLFAAVPALPGSGSGAGRCDAAGVGIARRAVCGEAGDAGCDGGGSDRRSRSDQGGARRARSGQRDDDALRAAAAGESRHLCGERAAGSGGEDSGGAVQHHAGRRRAD